MHTFAIGFGFAMLLFLGWDSGDWTRSDARQARAERTLTAPSVDADKIMDGPTAIPPRP
jgi:hypothetical protein